MVCAQLQRRPPEFPTNRPAQPRHRPARDGSAALGAGAFWAKDEKIAYSTINARAEKAASKPAFREALKRRRCLVPADAFYEWQRLHAKSKRPFAFALASGEPYAFAGLWESFHPMDNDPSWGLRRAGASESPPAPRPRSKPSRSSPPGPTS